MFRRILWLNTLILIASSFTARSFPLTLSRQRQRRFSPLVGRPPPFSGIFFLAGQVIAWRQLAAAGLFSLYEPCQQLFSTFSLPRTASIFSAGVLALLFIASGRPSADEGYRHGSRFDVLAFYGWALGFSVLFSFWDGEK